MKAHVSEAIAIVAIVFGLVSCRYIDQNARNVDKTLCVQAGGMWQPASGFKAAHCATKGEVVK